jgi:peptide/nickel transport system permease protein
MRLLRNPAAVAGLLLMLVVVAAALAGRIWFPGDPWAMDASPMLWPGENSANPLGTDFMGRDMATDLVSGARISLMIGLVSTAAAAAVGIGVGVLAGFYGGRTDAAILRLIEFVQTIPSFVLAVILVAVFQPSITMVVVAIGITSWPATARLTRAQVLSVRERDFVLAARTVGMSDRRILLSQILPNVLPPIIATITLTIAHAIQTEAALAFLGLSDPNVMSWGTIINGGREQLADAWYICGLPGLAILVTVLGLNLLGEGLNEVFNPHLRER